MKKFLMLLLCAILMFSFVACDDETPTPEKVEYTLEVPEYVMNTETTFKATVKGTDGSSKEVELDTPEVAGFQTVEADGIKATVYVADVEIKDKAGMIAFFKADSANKNAIITESIDFTELTATENFYNNADSTLVGTKDVVVKVDNDPSSNQGIILVSANNVTFKNFTIEYVGKEASDKNYRNVEHIVKVTDVMEAPNNFIDKFTIENVVLKTSYTEAETTYSCAGLNLHGTSNATVKNVKVEGEPTKNSLSLAESTNVVVDSCDFVNGSWSCSVQLNWANRDTYTKGVEVEFKNTDNIPNVVVTTKADGKPAPHNFSGLDAYECINGEDKDTGDVNDFYTK